MLSSTQPLKGASELGSFESELPCSLSESVGGEGAFERRALLRTGMLRAKQELVVHQRAELWDALAAPSVSTMKNDRILLVLST